MGTDKNIKLRIVTDIKMLTTLYVADYLARELIGRCTHNE